jgi:hypothetical protein|tara:strand:+ start:37 stop:222 length:186 start_codon:yes stop_codon:yes gene_type:complete
MEGEYQISHEEIQAAWYHFWGKNKLALDDHGKVYRTSTPRKMPDNSSLDYKNEKRKASIYT